MDKKEDEMKTKMHTTFRELVAAGACMKGYKKLARNLGGIKNYGPDTPITYMQILESNGIKDCIWALNETGSDDGNMILKLFALACAIEAAIDGVFDTSRDVARYVAWDVAITGSISETIFFVSDAARSAAMSAARDVASDFEMKYKHECLKSILKQY